MRTTGSESTISVSNVLLESKTVLTPNRNAVKPMQWNVRLGVLTTERFLHPFSVSRSLPVIVPSTRRVNQFVLTILLTTYES
jgi:hypothetical protein